MLPEEHAGAKRRPMTRYSLPFVVCAMILTDFVYLGVLEQLSGNWLALSIPSMVVVANVILVLILLRSPR